MYTNRYVRGLAIYKNDSTCLLSEHCNFPLPIFSTCGGTVLAVASLFHFTLFIRGFPLDGVQTVLDFCISLHNSTCSNSSSLFGIH